MKGVNRSIEEPVTYRTIIQKVLVLGENPALMAGFVNQAAGSNIAYHLYSTLGVGIGVSRVMTPENIEVIMQLWLIPREERLSGINVNFRRGHTGTVVVLSEEELDTLSFHLDSINPDKIDSLVVIIIGGPRISEKARAITQAHLKREVSLHDVTSVTDAVFLLGSNLIAQYNKRDHHPVVIQLNPEECPKYHYVPGQGYLPECSPDDIEFIKDLAGRIGATIEDDFPIIGSDAGRFSVDIRTGAVSFTPVLCGMCSRKCKRNSNICIVSVDEGWSSEDVGTRALLVVAKIWALASGELPEHVRKQIRMASQCKDYVQNASSSDMKSLSILGYRAKGKRRSLIEEANERVTLHQLTASAFDVLKDKWQKIRGLSTEDDK